MIGAPKQIEAGRKNEDVAREVGVWKHMIYAWKAKYGGMDVRQAQEVKQFRDENTRLRKPFATVAPLCVCLRLRIREALPLEWEDVGWLQSRVSIRRWIVQQQCDKN